MRGCNTINPNLLLYLLPIPCYFNLTLLQTGASRLAFLAALPSHNSCNEDTDTFNNISHLLPKCGTVCKSSLPFNFPLYLRADTCNTLQKFISPLYGCSAIGVLPAASPQSKGSALKNWDDNISTIKFCAV